MAIKKGRLKFEGGNDYADVFHPETSADIVIETTDFKVFTATERTKLAGIANNANNYTHPNHTGDVTSTGDGATVIVSNAVTTLKIIDGAVTNAKLAVMTNATIKGRVTTGSGSPEDLTSSQVRSMLNVADGANNYTHPSGDGNFHVPVTGTVNSNKVLKAGATAGSLSWGTLTYTDVGASPTIHTHAQADITGLTVALGALAPLASPALTGNPTAPTQIAGTNSTRLATCEFVTTAIGTRAFTSHTHTIADINSLQTTLDGKQPNLVSGTNIKTLNSASLLGGGNIAIGNASMLVFTNVQVATGSFVADVTYSGYGYKADITCVGVTVDYKADVVFAPAEADSGDYSSVCLTGVDTVTIYAKKIPASLITVPTITAMKVV
jgi:hypothetical protein